MRIRRGDDLSGMNPRLRRVVETHIRDLGEAGVDLGQLRDRRTRKTRRAEQDAGAALVDWMDRLWLPDGTRPGLYFCHVANGGARTPIEGAILKGQGVRKGWPDYHLDLPRGPYIGLRLELKAMDSKKPSEEQLAVLERLEAVGCCCKVAWGLDEAIAAVEAYLELPPWEKVGAGGIRPRSSAAGRRSPRRPRSGTR